MYEWVVGACIIILNSLFIGTSFLTGRKKLGNPVKFSLEADLSEQECRKLLIRYTPKHMLKNKTTQKLFVKLVYIID